MKFLIFERIVFQLITYGAIGYALYLANPNLAAAYLAFLVGSIALSLNERRIKAIQVEEVAEQLETLKRNLKKDLQNPDE